MRCVQVLPTALLLVGSLPIEALGQSVRPRQDRAFARQVEPLAIPVRGKLFHQVSPTHSPRLERSIARAFQAWPSIWKERGDLIWTSQGKRYFEYGDRASQMGVFLLRPRRGWRFVARDQLELDPETNTNSLHTFWLQQAQAAGGPMPLNRFSTRLQEQLRSEGLPDHSDFYERYRIAGFQQADYRDRPKSSFVFVHDLGGEVKLLTPSDRRRR